MTCRQGQGAGLLGSFVAQKSADQSGRKCRLPTFIYIEISFPFLFLLSPLCSYVHRIQEVLMYVFCSFFSPSSPCFTFACDIASAWMFASHCGKQRGAMIANAFRSAQNTAAQPPPPPPPLPPPPPPAHSFPRKRCSAPMIANTHNDSISQSHKSILLMLRSIPLSLSLSISFPITPLSISPPLCFPTGSVNPANSHKYESL